MSIDDEMEKLLEKKATVCQQIEKLKEKKKRLKEEKRKAKLQAEIDKIKE